MRSQRHKRPKHRVIVPWPENGPNPGEVADQARYVGSGGHAMFEFQAEWHEAPGV